MTQPIQSVLLPVSQFKPSTGPRRAERPAVPATRAVTQLPEGVRLVKTRRTRLSGEQAAAALDQAWSRVTGEAPSKRTLAVLTAQWAHETGRGASMMNFNFGGIKGNGPNGLSAAYHTREGWGANERHIVDRFRAYETAADGAEDYVRFITRRYPEATQAAREGDPEGFVRALKQRKYFTGNEAAYVRSVKGMSEAALTRGFDALSGTQGGMAPARLEFEAAAVPRVDAAPTLETLNFLGVESIADEVSRAAFRAQVEAQQRDQEQR